MTTGGSGGAVPEDQARVAALEARVAALEAENAALRRTGTLYEALSDNAPAVLYVKDRDGRFLLQLSADELDAIGKALPWLHLAPETPHRA